MREEGEDKSPLEKILYIDTQEVIVQGILHEGYIDVRPVVKNVREEYHGHPFNVVDPSLMLWSIVQFQECN